jgi:hypothetical protein
MQDPAADPHAGPVSQEDTAMTPTARQVAARVLEHLVGRIADTPALDDPFGHFYLTDVLQADVYAQLLAHFPDPGRYVPAAERHYKSDGGFVRSQLPLTVGVLDTLPSAGRELWRGLAAALTDPALKRAVFTRLAPDLAYRYAVPLDQAGDLPGFSRPTLYREIDGFEIPPHPDTRKKVVTMHLYLPADLSQVGLGTALYRRRPLALPVGPWPRRFARVKQFEFRPNSGYAFVVNNTLLKKSWHGRERLPAGAGVRNTLLNTFYASPRDGYAGYLDPAAAPLPAQAAA